MKYLTLLLLIVPILSFSQKKEIGWQHLDPIDDSTLGISTLKGHQYLSDKKANTVIVAIIDNGVELTHEDLEGVFWVNKDEIKNNGIDDDGNGYIDDINGWNFLGNSNGENLKMETTELTRSYAFLRDQFKDKEIREINSKDLAAYKTYQIVKRDYELSVKNKTEELAYYKDVISYYKQTDYIIKKHLKTATYTEQDVRSIKKGKDEVIQSRDFLIQLYDGKVTKEYFEKQVKNIEKELKTRLNPDFNNRAKIVGDNPNNILDSIYGNNMLNVKGPYHGTGVASIVGALHNEFGVDGVAQQVKLMIIRIVPNGDERDKDIALAIKYAVRNGADIINCSFAKKYSTHYEFVQDAILLAEERGVLIVHGAGNSGTNNDKISYYPTGIKQDGIVANNWITVGASLSSDDENLAAFFSNYGKTSVDIFAPGYEIKNCILNNKYDKGSGTSIAAPVVAGLAAVLKSYYPYLTAKDLKEIIIKSAYIPKTKRVLIPGENKVEKVNFSDLSISGGIANLYKAILLIEKEYKNEP